MYIKWSVRKVAVPLDVILSSLVNGHSCLSTVLGYCLPRFLIPHIVDSNLYCHQHGDSKYSVMWQLQQRIMWLTVFQLLIKIIFFSRYSYHCFYWFTDYIKSCACMEVCRQVVLTLDVSFWMESYWTHAINQAFNHRLLLTKIKALSPRCNI